jgi:branched-chain amino acid transport system permease protein
MTSDLANAVVAGLTSGALYSLVAIGLVVVFACTNIFNFAHGEMVMMATYTSLILSQSFKVPLLLSFVLTIAAVAAVGALTERVAVRPSLRIRDASGWIIATFGAAVIIQSTFSLATTEPGQVAERLYPSYLPWDRAWRLGDVIFDPNRILILVVMLLVASGLSWFQRQTSYGRAMQAIADDREGAAARGIPVTRIAVLSFCIGAAVAAITGIVAGPVTQARVTVGLSLTLKGFVAATLGGIPSIGGAVVGGMLLGLVEQFTAQYTSGELVSPITLAVLLLVLGLRPTGLLGRRVRVV